VSSSVAAMTFVIRLLKKIVPFSSQLGLLFFWLAIILLFRILSQKLIQDLTGYVIYIFFRDLFSTLVKSIKIQDYRDSNFNS
jgi:hypothetical protein